MRHLMRLIGLRSDIIAGRLQLARLLPFLIPVLLPKYIAGLEIVFLFAGVRYDTLLTFF